MSTTEQNKRLSQESIFCVSTQICPKCQNVLIPAGLQDTDRGTQFVYECTECGSSFAFVLCTEYHLFEVIH